MIASLRGQASKDQPGMLTVDVQGVGYRVLVPMTVWDSVQEDHEVKLSISPYIREERFDLFGFSDRGMQTLFEKLLNISGIGPRTALEICSVPGELLSMAVQQNDPRQLGSIKGVGKKTAEKILIELRALFEKHEDLFASPLPNGSVRHHDNDALEALRQLGFSAQKAMKALSEVPSELTTTEERLTAALRHM